MINKILSFFLKRKIDYKKLNILAKNPIKAHDTDACYDLTSTWVSETEDYIEYGTDIAFDIPVGYVGLIFPRSSITKEDIILKNSVGVIDSGYQGEIRFRFSKLVNDCFTEANLDNTDVIDLQIKNRKLKKYSVGERVGQIMFIKLPTIQLNLVNNFKTSDRGNKGFGSSGK